MKLSRLQIIGASVGMLCMLAVSAYGGYHFGIQKGKDASFFTHIENAQTGIEATVASDDVTQTIDFRDFWHVWQVLDQNFAETHATQTPRTNQDRVLFAIQGLTKSYDDPFTEFVPKKAAEVLKTAVNGGFGGIGAVLNKVDSYLYVLSVVPESPAALSGIQAGDEIVAIDGIPVDTELLDASVARIRGESGTSVNLTVRRNNRSELVTLTRNLIALPTTASVIITRVESVPQTIQKNVEHTTEEVVDAVSKVLPELPASIVQSVAPAPETVENDYYIIGLSSFSKTTPKAFEKELRQFNASNARALIIDLRNNPGGYLDVALTLTSYFLPEGEVVVRERIGGNPEEQVYTSLGLGTQFPKLSERPIYILINGYSASASEIFAGALKEHDRATLVGTRSYGKGSVQSMVDIGTLGTLKVTVARWFTPNGVSLSGNGLEPDIVVDVNAQEWKGALDPFVEAALKDLE